MLLLSISRLYHRYTVPVAMALSSALCMFLLALRIVRTRDAGYVYLAWNLFLAWLPLISAYAAWRLRGRSPLTLRLLFLACTGIWLIFLPNAPYLITDLVHLTPSYGIIFWFDLTMFMAFAWTGLLYGLVSLYWMQQLVLNRAGAVISWLFVVAVSALSAFGVYLGRFQRWNSWDLLNNPGGVLVDIYENFRHPIVHFQAFVFSGLFALFLISAYLMLNVLTHLQSAKAGDVASDATK